MTYGMYGFILMLLGLNILAYHGLTLHFKTLQSLLKVHPLAAYLKLLAVALGAVWVEELGMGVCAAWLEVAYEMVTVAGQHMLLQGLVEGMWVLGGAWMAAVIADGCIQLLEHAYHKWSMVVLKSTGLNLQNTGITYATTAGAFVPVTVMGPSLNSLSSSELAQKAIAKMEAEQKALKAAGLRS